MVPQAVLHIAELCAQHDINQVILSPGSRNAPLTLAFSRHPDINTRVISDERSAAYIALGLAQQSNQSVVLVCTSGTALLNYGPAVAEAFYQQVPLIVISADRPPEWIDQRDGQTIRQAQVFQSHTKLSVDLPVAQTHEDVLWHWQRLVNEAIVTAQAPMPGPVHINVPFREPFYPQAHQTWDYKLNLKIVKRSTATNQLSDVDWAQLQNKWLAAKRPLLVGGQYDYNPEELKNLVSFVEHYQVPLLGDGISNLHQIPGVVAHVELILGQSHETLADLQPDLLITWGKSVISKNLKKFLRHYPATDHWHLQECGFPSDTFKSLSRIIPQSPGAWFAQKKLPAQPNNEWYAQWQQQENRVSIYLKEQLPKTDWNELTAAAIIVSSLKEVDLHLANSMAVRWADLFGINPHVLKVWANRGTSGIDGCNSTAVGHSLASKEQEHHVLITGDMAFRYDRNAFWHQYPTSNLSIIILNNQGGGIFRLIDGPADQPELEDYFVTQQPYDARATAEELGFAYTAAHNEEELKAGLQQITVTSNQTMILEVMVMGSVREEYRNLKNLININHE